MEDIGFLGEDQSTDRCGEDEKMSACAGLPEADRGVEEKDAEKDLPGFVDGVAAVEDIGGRDGHAEGSEAGGRDAKHITEAKDRPNTEDAGEDSGEAEGPEFSAEEGLGNEDGVEMQGAVVVLGVVAVVAGGLHAVGEPAVDALIEMRGLDFDEPASENNRDEDDRYFRQAGAGYFEKHPLGIMPETMSNQVPAVSIVIPARNEALRLPSSIRAMRGAFPVEAWEFLVIVEKSEDGTAELAREAAGGDPRFEIVENSVARGKGYAVKSGMLRARGDWIFFMDADLSVPLRFVGRFLEQVAGADVLIGSRRHPDSVVPVRQPLAREAAGRVFNFALRGLGITRIADTQCGFKAFTREAAQEVFSRVEQDGFGFDVEALLIAEMLGLRLRELPVEWSDVKGSKVSPLNGFFALRDAVLAARRLRRKDR